MKICIDLDGVIATGMPYSKANPNQIIINKVNELYEKGYTIIIFTSRRERDRYLTKYWLRKNKVKHNKLVMCKPLVDKYFDDRNGTMEELMSLK